MCNTISGTLKRRSGRHPVCTVLCTISFDRWWHAASATIGFEPSMHSGVGVGCVCGLEWEQSTITKTNMLWVGRKADGTISVSSASSMDIGYMLVLLGLKITDGGHPPHACWKVFQGQTWASHHARIKCLRCQAFIFLDFFSAQHPKARLK